MATPALLDFIKNLLRDGSARQAFYDDPERVLAGAGFTAQCGRDVAEARDLLVDDPCTGVRDVASDDPGDDDDGVTQIKYVLNKYVYEGDTIINSDDDSDDNSDDDNSDDDGSGDDGDDDSENQDQDADVDGDENQVVNGHDNNTAHQESEGNGSPNVNGDGNIVVPILNGDILEGGILSGGILNGGGILSGNGDILSGNGVLNGLLGGDNLLAGSLNGLAAGSLNGLAAGTLNGSLNHLLGGGVVNGGLLTGGTLNGILGGDHLLQDGALNDLGGILNSEDGILNEFGGISDVIDNHGEIGYVGDVLTGDILDEGVRALTGDIEVGDILDKGISVEDVLRNANFLNNAARNLDANNLLRGADILNVLDDGYVGFLDTVDASGAAGNLLQGALGAVTVSDTATHALDNADILKSVDADVVKDTYVGDFLQKIGVAQGADVLDFDNTLKNVDVEHILNHTDVGGIGDLVNVDDVFRTVNVDDTLKNVDVSKVIDHSEIGYVGDTLQKFGVTGVDAGGVDASGAAVDVASNAVQLASDAVHVEDLTDKITTGDITVKDVTDKITTNADVKDLTDKITSDVDVSDVTDKITVVDDVTADVYDTADVNHLHVNDLTDDITSMAHVDVLH